MLARGLLWILAAAALHVTLFLFATQRRGEQSGGDRFVMPLSLSASAAALTLAVIESGFHAWMPVPSNNILDQSLMTGSPPLIEQALAATHEAYRALALRCRELGADLIVLLIPAAIQAEPARFQDFLRLHDEASRGSYSRTKLHRDLIDMLAGLGIRVVDPIAALTAEAEAGRPCYHREGHWNARGHAMAADMLVPVLAEIVAERQRRNPPGS